jgi:hypothetical protein
MQRLMLFSSTSRTHSSVPFVLGNLGALAET